MMLGRIRRRNIKEPIIVPPEIAKKTKVNA